MVSNSFSEPPPSMSLRSPSSFLSGSKYLGRARDRQPTTKPLNEQLLAQSGLGSQAHTQTGAVDT